MRHPRARALSWSIPSHPWRSSSGSTSWRHCHRYARVAPHTRSSGDEALPPDPVVSLPGAPARDPETRIVLEGFEQALEVVRVHRHVGVDVDDDVRVNVERLEGGV